MGNNVIFSLKIYLHSLQLSQINLIINETKFKTVSF